MSEKIMVIFSTFIVIFTFFGVYFMDPTESKNRSALYSVEKMFGSIFYAILAGFLSYLCMSYWYISIFIFIILALIIKFVR